MQSLVHCSLLEQGLLPGPGAGRRTVVRAARGAHGVGMARGEQRVRAFGEEWSTEAQSYCTESRDRLV